MQTKHYSVRERGIGIAKFQAYVMDMDTKRNRVFCRVGQEIFQRNVKNTDESTNQVLLCLYK